MTIGETDELLTLKHNMEITPLRAFDPMPTLPEISANGVIFSTENEFEASGEAMIIQDREGNYFLRFENFSLPSLQAQSGKELNIYKKREEKEKQKKT